jgi:phosphoglycerate dehydrogenase-like enzyme
MSQPHIAIIDGAANVIRALCETDADLTDEICRNGVGFDSVDIAACVRGIAVCNEPLENGVKGVCS